MGMSYAELKEYGTLRKIERAGPLSMYKRLVAIWSHLQPKEVADKVKHFYKFYAINRHKMTTLTPALHAESYSIDDNRFDLRPFLINSNWTYQFKKIDEEVEKLKKSDKKEM